MRTGDIMIRIAQHLL